MEGRGDGGKGGNRDGRGGMVRKQAGKETEKKEEVIKGDERRRVEGS